MLANLLCKSGFHNVRWTSIFTIGCSIGLSLSAAPVLAANRVSAVYGPLEISIPVSEIETFAKSGTIPQNFKPYLQFLSSKQQSELRNVLQERLQVDTQSIQSIGKTPMGKDLLNRLSNVLQSDPRQDRTTLLLQGMVSASKSPQGLTVVSLFQNFPADNLRLNVEPLLQARTELTALLKYRDTSALAIAKQMDEEIATMPSVDFAKTSDLRKPGPFKFDRKTLTLSTNPNRQSSLSHSVARQFEVDIYLPQRQTQPSPVIIISHGLGSAPINYSYLAEHFASYGFVAALPQHIGSDTKSLKAIIDGQSLEDVSPAEFLDRPLDIKDLLNELTRLSHTDSAFKGQLNLQKIGIVGHSFGAYTSLALAGAEINHTRLKEQCVGTQPTFNLSLIFQCRAKVLPSSNYNLSDSRIKAVIAVSPLASTVFGPEGIGNIKIPTMIMSSSHDVLTPAIPEQIYPFLWLKTPHKYLALLMNAGHSFPNDPLHSQKSLSASDESLQSRLSGADPPLARVYLQALSLAFMQTHLGNFQSDNRYLSPAYAKYLSRPPIKLEFVRSLTPAQLEQAYGGSPPFPILSPSANPEPIQKITSEKEVNFFVSLQRWFQHHLKQLLAVLQKG
jgi:predicted dienelactone hydrolase